MFCFEVEIADIKQLILLDFFINLDATGKEYKEAFTFRVHIEDTIKSVKEFKKGIRYVLFVMIIF